MHIDTKNVLALELLKKAQMSVSLYQQSKEFEKLEEAKTNLESALQTDENYLRARFWKGLVNDLLGNQKEAVKELEEVKNAVISFEPMSFRPQKRKTQKIRHFLTLVEYNLGVAKYHQYSRSKVDEGIRFFRNVIEQTENDELRLLAKAWLAKALAMKILPPLPPVSREKPSVFYEKLEDFQPLTDYLQSKKPERNAEKFFALSRAEYSEVIEAVNAGNELSDTAKDTKGVAYDAKAIAIMFHTDFIAEDRINSLEEALAALTEADKYRPKDWAIYCNFGSINMRLGYWRKVEAEKASEGEAKKLLSQSAENFKKAHEYLDKVLKELRPGYGFALYEKGRVYRLDGDFTNAIIYFEKSLKVPANRDVSDPRLEFEKERANRELTTFP